MKFWLCFLGLWLSSSTINAQQLHHYNNVVCFDVTETGTVYLFDGNNLISWQGKEHFRHHTLGNIITSIDASNPFEILVFYQNIQSFQLFDNRLSPISPISKLPTNYWVNDIKQGVNNQFWFVSYEAQVLGKFNRNLSLQWQFQKELYNTLRLLGEREGKLFAYNSEKIVVVSATGAISEIMNCSNTISAASILNSENLLINQKEQGKFAIINTQQKTEQALDISELKLEQMKWKQASLYYMFNNEINTLPLVLFSAK